MSTEKPVSAPPRLSEGALGRLLKQANREFAADLDQPAAFRRVNERLAASRSWLAPRPRWWVPATLLVIGGFAVTRLLPVDDVTVVVAEAPSVHRSVPPVASVSPEPEAIVEQPTAPPKPRGAGTLQRRAEAPSVPSVAPSPTPRGSASGSEPPPPKPPEAATPGTSGGPDCLSLARGGKTGDAEACFLSRAEGSGLAAEMALYEVARLRRDVLADAQGALGALAQYRARFPAGSLRREVDMSQLELLLQLGRSEEALQQSAELIGSSASGERAAELYLLRGNILRKQGRFAAAAGEYELAEQAGARVAEVKYFRALCLEALGRGAEAASLFRQYLEQPRRLYAEDAKRRMEKLQP